jgi:methylated-DNA-[protein]-cysteine S-methyltransferase
MQELNMELYNTIFLTVWGYMSAQVSEHGLWALTFPKQTKEEVLTDKALTSGQEYFPQNSLIQELTCTLNLYFKGLPVTFNIPIDWRGYTDFQKKVLQKTNEVPYGKVSTYGCIAEQVGSPKAARAVGGALHINRTPIVVPCHRVIGANGSLTGFGGGVPLKEALLNLEATQIYTR